MFSALSHFVFGASSLFSSSNQSDGIKTSSWKDKKLCFDLRPHDIELNRGEQLIGCFYPIEDVKGNQDELGLLKVTNLRLIWVCVKRKRVNLSIGWRTVTLTYEQNLKDPLSGSSTNLFVLSKYESTKYEFVFARQANQADIWTGGACDPDSWRAMSQLRRLSQDKFIVSHLTPVYLDDPFEVVLKVWQAYKQTHLFRHCRSNINYLVVSSSQSPRPPDGLGADLKLTDINRLPGEEIIEVFSSVDQIESRTFNHTGTLLLTNIRLIWIDGSINVRNLSIPYIRINSLKLKQAHRIVLNTNDYLSNSTQVEFQAKSSISGINGTAGGSRVTAKVIFEQIQNLYLLYKSNPRYGPESTEECINFISHLKAIELYFDTLDTSMVKAMENFGPEVHNSKASGDGKNKLSNTRENERLKVRSNKAGSEDEEDEDEVDRAERELDGYTTKLACYLNGRPLGMDNDVTYWNDLGLAMERPANGASIDSIWRIDV